MSRFTSLLLAAGQGTRLRPLTGQIPKPALPLLDVPLGAYGLTALETVGGPLFVNVSHGGDIVRTQLEPFAPSAVFVQESPEPFGTAATLAHLRERITGPVVTHNADSLTDASIVDAIAAHVAGGTQATIVTRAVPEHADLVAEGDRAIRFVDRRMESLAGEMWLGIAIVERDALDLITPEGPKDLAMGLLAGLIERGEVTVHRHTGYFMDVGTIARYLRASVDVLNGAMPRLGSTGVVDVGGGRAFVASSARVEAGSIGPGAVVLDGAAVPSDAYVTNGIVWRDEAVPGGARIEGGVWAFGALQR